MEEKDITFSVFGGFGFIGKEICSREDFVPNESVIGDRQSYVGKTNKLVYLISTIHNYNILDDDPYVDIETNLTHLMKVLEANREKYGKDFDITFVSSWFVYGKTDECPATEKTPCNPTGFYSITKRTAEQLLISYCETFGIKWKIVRLANVMGVGDLKASRRKNALQYMIKTLCEGGMVHLYNGEIYRDYVSVTDVAKAIRKVATQGAYDEIYNVGSGVGVKITDLVNYAQDIVGGEVVKVSAPSFHQLVQVDKMWLDSSKIKEKTGWEAHQTAYEIVDDLIKHYRRKDAD